MKFNDIYSKETTKDKDRLLLKSESQKGNDRKRIVLYSLPPSASKDYDADESSSEDGLSYGSDTNSSSGDDYESRCSFPIDDDDELSHDEEEVFSEDEIDFDLGDSFEERTRSKVEEKCLFYFSCESFESSFDLDEPLYTIQEEQENDSHESCHNHIQDENGDCCDCCDDDDDDYDDPLAISIRRSDAFQMLQETKDDTDPYFRMKIRHFTDFQSIPYSFENPIFNSFGIHGSLFLSDIENGIKLFTISEEPELEEALWQEERLSAGYRQRQ